MDLDDIAHPDRFAIQIDYLEKHRDCMIVGSMVDYIDDTEPLKLVNISDAITVKFEKPQIMAGLLNCNSSIANSTTIFRTVSVQKVFDKYGFYYSESPIFDGAEDDEFWTRFCLMDQSLAVEILSAKLLYYRVWDNNYSSLRSKNRILAHSQIIKAFLERLDVKIPEDLLQFWVLFGVYQRLVMFFIFYTKSVETSL
ncbi:hypothetical protein [Streptococcus suis]|uniref:hypothetical protein n=1 Tax=Streptococcus suis TaxID=1307 RepID=UPI0014780F0C